MSVIDRAKNIILTPKTEWDKVAAETPNIPDIFTGYVLPLALIPTIASLIGFGFVGVLGYSSFALGIAHAVREIIVAFLAVYVGAYVIDFLAPNFSSDKNLGRAIQLVAYSFTPGWVAGIFYIIPGLMLLVLLGSLYGLYILYVGISPMMKTPQDKVGGYFVLSLIAMIIVYLVIGAVVRWIVFAIFGLGSTAMAG